MKFIKYWGNKKDVVDKLISLLPEDKIETYVETCMGTGVFSQLMQHDGIKNIAIEKEPGMVALNKIIRDNPDELYEKLKEFKYCEEEFITSLELLKNAINGTQYDAMELAVAEYKAIVMSINNMRTTFRQPDSWKRFRERYIEEHHHEPSDKIMDRKQRDLKQLIDSIYNNMASTILFTSQRLQHVKILEGDFMDYPEYWSNAETFVFCDPPYMYRNRGIKYNKKKGTAGYLVDMNDDDHLKFLNWISELYRTGKLKSHIMICSNYEYEDGKIVGLQDDAYMQALLPLGFRLVVIDKRKYTSEVKNGRSAKAGKKEKREVVFINYRNIRGRWDGVEYYDYRELEEKVK